MLLPTKIFWSPRNIILDPTNSCNYQCIMCRTQHNKRDSFVLTYQDFVTVSKKYSPRYMAFGATGEPLLAEDLSLMIKDSSRRGYRTILNTNGSMLSQSMDWISYVNVIKVSLDTHDPQRYKEIRGGRLDDITESLRKIVQLKGPRIRLEYVVMSINYKEMSDFVRFGKDLGVDGAFFRLYEGTDLPPEVNQELMNVPGIQEEIEQAMIVADKLHFSTNLPDLYRKREYVVRRYLGAKYFNDNRDKRVCLLPWVQLFIRADGETSPCCEILELENVSMGNALKQENIWNSEAMISLRKKFLKKENYGMFDCCKTCEYLDWKQILRWTKLVPGWFL